MYPRQYFDTYWRTDLSEAVFVAMPFHSEFESVWSEAIKPAIEDVGLVANRVDTSVLSGSIITDILDGIANSRLILADLSIQKKAKWKGQRNGNVMYEVGLSHAIRQPEEIILIRCDHKEINFDLAGIRVNRYKFQDLTDTRLLITKLIKDALRMIDRSKSLQVQRAIAALDSDCLEYLYKYRNAEGFGEANPTELTDIVESIASKAAQVKLQSLGITMCSPIAGHHISMYEWTEFGKAVLRRLSYRSSK